MTISYGILLYLLIGVILGVFLLGIDQKTTEWKLTKAKNIIFENIWSVLFFITFVMFYPFIVTVVKLLKIFRPDIVSHIESINHDENTG